MRIKNIRLGRRTVVIMAKYVESGIKHIIEYSPIISLQSKTITTGCWSLIITNGINMHEEEAGMLKEKAEY